MSAILHGILAEFEGPEALLAAVRWPGSAEPVLVVGHQPTLGMAAARLLAGHDHPWTMKKAAVWWLRQRERDDDEQVVLLAVQGVEML